MTVTVTKVGGRVAVVIPGALAREMALTEGTPLEITSGGADSIVIRKAGRRPRRSLRDIVARIKPAAYRRRGRGQAEKGPVGKEVW